MRLKKDNMMVHARRRHKNNTTLSYCISVNTENGDEFGFAEFFIKICRCIDNECVLNCNDSSFFVVFKKAEVDRNTFRVPTNMTFEQYMDVNEIQWITVPYIKRIQEFSEIKLIRIEQITNVCILMNNRDSIMLIQPANASEYDE